MAGLLTKLFAPKPNRSARRTAPATTAPRPKTRLSFDGLETREMPAIATLTGGVLQVVGDGAYDKFEVYNERNQVVVRDMMTDATQSFAAASVVRLDLRGTAGDDYIENRTALPSRIDGRAGRDVLWGGTGTDVFIGSPGDDQYNGGPGADVLYRNGYRAQFRNAQADDLVVGLVSGRLTPAELTATGRMTAALDPADPQRLVLSGPTGAGFSLRSNWAAAGDGFSTTTGVTLETYYGSVTLPGVAGQKTTVRTADAPVGGAAGYFRDVTWAGIPVTGSTNPLNSILDTATGGIGLDLDLPGLSWGIALGDAVKDLDGDAPLNDAVPYLYAHLSTGASLSYSGASVSTPQSFSGTFTFSPGDGTVYVAAAGMPVVTDLALAVSPQGYIPYTPDRIPTGLQNPNIYGHFYSRGAVDLGDAGVPIEVRGNVVVDLDANDDGRLVGTTSSSVAGAVRSFFTGITNPSTFRTTASSVVNDVAVGFNGGVSLSVSVLSLDLGSASAWYKPGEVAFRAATTNPFENIPVLQKLGTGGGTFDVQGYTRWTTGSNAAPSWYFRADTRSAMLGGMAAGSLYLEAGNTILGGGGIRAGARVDGPLGVGRISVTGQIGFDGSFSLSGIATVHESFDVGPFEGGFSFTVTMSIGYNRRTDTFTFGGSISAGVWFGIDGLGKVGASFSASVTFWVSPGSLRFRAEGEISAWYDPPGPMGRKGFTIGFELTQSSLKLELPGLPDPTIRW